MAESRGRCLCGAVRFAIAGELRPVMYCYCEQCRRTSGHYVASTACDIGDLKFVQDEGLRWYSSSNEAERGFCGRCGSSLFWKPAHRRYISVMAGALDQPTGLEACAHIYVAGRPDYFDILDELPQFEGDSESDWGP